MAHERTITKVSRRFSQKRSVGTVRHDCDFGRLSVEQLEPRQLMSAVTASDDLHQGQHDELHGHGCSCGICTHNYPVIDVSLADGDALNESSSGFDTEGFQELLADGTDVFNLHSNAAAAHTIYLDFDGHTTTGTIWNSYLGISSIYNPGLDEDGDASSFDLTEQQLIYEAWVRVSEDFAPFDVNVTTADPGLERLRRSGSGDSQWGVRVVIGGDGSWYSRVGGVAFVSSFTSNQDTPAFVFSENMYGSAKSNAEAISHEVGHTLGLYHDGTSSASYYSGHGSGQTGWASIMGVGYYRNLTQWSQGEYNGADNNQDDLARITSGNGFSYRADDHGSVSGGATALTFNDDNSIEDSGIIERNTDVDMFSFTVGDGTLTIDIDGAQYGTNLDIAATIYDSDGNAIANSNPDNTLDASFNVDLAAGTYYLAIDGVGKGDPLASGYTDYGSLGQYSISGSFSGSVLDDDGGSGDDDSGDDDSGGENVVDQHGNTRQEATDIGLLDGRVNLNDSIGASSDTDDFIMFQVRGRRIKFDASMTGLEAGASMQLLNKRGKVMMEVDGSVGVDANMTRNLRRGKYYIRIFQANNADAAQGVQDAPAEMTAYSLTMETTQQEKKKKRRRRR